MNNKGFTLIELLVVVLIIGILAAIALPQYKMAVMKARMKGNLPIVRALANARDVFWLYHARYPKSFEELYSTGFEFPAGGEEEIDGDGDLNMVYENQHIRFVAATYDDKPNTKPERVNEPTVYVEWDGPNGDTVLLQYFSQSNMEESKLMDPAQNGNKKWIESPGDGVCYPGDHPLCKSVCYNAVKTHNRTKWCNFH